jgi:hypothetical protein
MQVEVRKVAHVEEACAAGDGVWTHVGAHWAVYLVAWECSPFSVVGQGKARPPSNAINYSDALYRS